MQSPLGRQQSVVRVKILTLAACTWTRPPTYLSASQDPYVTWVKCQAGTVPRIRYNACVFHTQYSLNTTLIYIKQKTQIRFSHPPNQTNKEISKHKSEVNNSVFNTLKTATGGTQPVHSEPITKPSLNTVQILGWSRSNQTSNPASVTAMLGSWADLWWTMKSY